MLNKKSCVNCWKELRVSKPTNWEKTPESNSEVTKINVPIIGKIHVVVACKEKSKSYIEKLSEPTARSIKVDKAVPYTPNLMLRNTSMRESKKLKIRNEKIIICSSPVRESVFNSLEISEAVAPANSKLKKLKKVSLPVKKEKNARIATMEKTISAKSTDKTIKLNN